MEQRKTYNTTLVLILKGDKILLGEKKRGFAVGTIIGIGGKQDVGETIDQAMIRETQEEIGVTPKKYERVGTILFDTRYKGELCYLNTAIYNVYDYDGKICETDEIKPTWYNKLEIPYSKMMPVDSIWMPMVLDGKKIDGKAKYDDNRNLVSCVINGKSFNNSQLDK